MLSVPVASSVAVFDVTENFHMEEGWAPDSNARYEHRFLAAGPLPRVLVVAVKSQDRTEIEAEI